MPASSPGLAPGNSPYRHPASFKQTVFPERLNGILRTTGGEPALRSQPGRNNPLIKFNQPDQGQTEYLKNFLHAID
jgi:hypothetical protein